MRSLSGSGYIVLFTVCVSCPPGFRSKLISLFSDMEHNVISSDVFNFCKFTFKHFRYLISVIMFALLVIADTFFNVSLTLSYRMADNRFPLLGRSFSWVREIYFMVQTFTADIVLISVFSYIIIHYLYGCRLVIV